MVGGRTPGTPPGGGSVTVLPCAGAGAGGALHAEVSTTASAHRAATTGRMACRLRKREGGLFRPGSPGAGHALLLQSSRERRDGDARTARSRRGVGSGRLSHRGDAGDFRSRSPGRTSVSDHLKADQAMYAVVVAAMTEKKA